MCCSPEVKKITKLETDLLLVIKKHNIQKNN